MLKKLMLFALLFSLVLTGVAADESVTKEIGDETVVFEIPDDLDLLKSRYKALINAYVKAENDALSKSETIKDYGELVKELSTANATLQESNNSLQESLKKYETNVDAYIKFENKAAWYLGGFAGFQLSLDNRKISTFGPSLVVIKPG